MNEYECPLPLQSNELNAQNHLYVIQNFGLGPADPRQPNTEFWQDKAQKWGISEGDARGRLCANCEHYLETTAIKECINNGPAKNIKASSLPLEPKWADIESRPTAYCTLYHITCSPVRTCDSQEMGGPIDDVKQKALELAKAIEEADMDVEEIVDINEDTTKEDL